MKRCRVSSHHLGSALRTIFIKDLVQDCFLLEAINVIRCFRSDYQILLLFAYQTIVTRLRQLMMLNRIWILSPAMDLLQQVVLLLAHNQTVSRSISSSIGSGCTLRGNRLFLTLLELILQALCIYPDPAIRNDLLTRVACNGTLPASTTRIEIIAKVVTIWGYTTCLCLHLRKAWVERQEIVLKINDFYIRLREKNWRGSCCRRCWWLLVSQVLVVLSVLLVVLMVLLV